MISDNGITTAVNGVGVIPWEFINGFSIGKGINFEALVILLNDEEAFFQGKNTFVKRLMQSNIRRFGSPAIIPASEFHVSLPEVVEQLKAYQNS